VEWRSKELMKELEEAEQAMLMARRRLLEYRQSQEVAEAYLREAIDQSLCVSSTPSRAVFHTFPRLPRLPRLPCLTVPAPPNELGASCPPWYLSCARACDVWLRCVQRARCSKSVEQASQMYKEIETKVEEHHVICSQNVQSVREALQIAETERMEAVRAKVEKEKAEAKHARMVVESKTSEAKAALDTATAAAAAAAAMAVGAARAQAQDKAARLRKVADEAEAQAVDAKATLAEEESDLQESLVEVQEMEAELALLWAGLQVASHSAHVSMITPRRMRCALVHFVPLICLRRAPCRARCTSCASHTPIRQVANRTSVSFYVCALYR
jgi:hypothetical protein